MFKGKLLHVLLAFVFLVGAVLMPINLDSSYAGEGKKVLVYIERMEAEGFKRGGFDVIEIYDTFSLFSVNASEEEILKVRNIEYTEVPNIDKIFYANREFTSDGAKNMVYPTDVQAKIGTLPSEGLFLLQFVGPVKQEWKDFVVNQGVKIYGSLQYSAYLVRTTQSVASNLKPLEFIRTIGQVPGYLKVSQELFEQDTPLNDNVIVSTTSEFNLPNFLEKAKVREQDHIFYTSFGVGRLRLFNYPLAKLNILYGDNDVIFIEKMHEAKIANEHAAQVVGIRTSANNVNLPNNNTGEHQIVAVADTGLSTGTQDDTMHPNFGTNGSKVVAHYGYNQGVNPVGGDWSCFVGDNPHTHGTHVAGSVLGDGDTSPSGNYKGMASGAKLVVQRIMNSTGALQIPGYDTLFSDAYYAGARIHSNSWGSRGNYYGSSASEIDEYMWNNKDFSILFAMGNDGPNEGTIMAEPNSKNCISVGASQNNSVGFNQNRMASFSSRGFTYDGRIKPDVVAPGQVIYSSITNGTRTNPNNTWEYSQGTSMATPVTAGSLACIREFFTHGTVVTDYRNPSSALLKAAMINGCYFDGMQSSSGVGYTSPDGNIGWGRVDVKESLDPISGRVKFYDHPMSLGLMTGQTHYIEFSVGSGASLPLDITLVWTDAPAGSGSDPALVNNLDLKLVTPDGDYYYGNRFDEDGKSQLNPATTDALNNVEVIRIPAAVQGNYRIEVSGANIQQGVQPFAVAYRGNIYSGSEPEPPPVEESLRLTVSPQHRVVLRGSSTDYAASITSVGVSGDVTFSLEFKKDGIYKQSTELGITYTIEPPILSVSSGVTLNSQIEINVSTSTPIGDIEVIVHASTPSHAADPVTVIMNVITEPYFLLDFEPATVYVRQSQTESTMINITPMFGFSEEVVFDDIYGLPENTTISFKPMPTGPNTQYRSKVTIETTLDTPIGTYMISIRARNITTSRDVSIYRQFKLVVSRRVNVYKAEVYCKSVPETVDVGDEVKFRFQMKNTGNEPLINNMLVFHLDPNLEFMFSEPAANYSDGKLYLGIRDLAAGECYPYACSSIGYPGVSDKDGDYIVIKCRVKDSKMNSGGASYQLQNKVEVISDPAYKRTFSICPVTVRPKQAGEYPLYFKVYFENLDSDGAISAGSEVKVKFQIQGGSGDYLYSWDWSDGNMIQDEKIGIDPIELTHTYNKKGVYRITITARDSKGRYKKGEVILRVK